MLAKFYTQIAGNLSKVRDVEFLMEFLLELGNSCLIAPSDEEVVYIDD
jgi:hypothetical protein